MRTRRPQRARTRRRGRLKALGAGIAHVTDASPATAFLRSRRAEATPLNAAARTGIRERAGARSV